MTDESDGDGKLELLSFFVFALFLGRENSKLCSGSKKLELNLLLLQFFYGKWSVSIYCFTFVFKIF